jgi:hypothetical protein
MMNSQSSPMQETGSTLVYPLSYIHIDPERLLTDFRNMKEDDWVEQNRYKDGFEHWRGIALYSVSGDARDLRCADRLPVRKTTAGERCPYICNELLPQCGAPWLRVVFYRLEAGTQIPEHRDHGQNRHTLGMVRIHIPVITNEKIVMYVEKKPYHFPLGTAWYFDASARHSVENNSDQDRTHLVVDLLACEDLEKRLKPLTLSDHCRYIYLGGRYYINVAETFYKFLWTREGRARIRARATQLARGKKR